MLPKNKKSAAGRLGGNTGGKEKHHAYSIQHMGAVVKE